MKAVIVPQVHGKWQLKDVPDPKPGPDQVLIKMHASGICYTDVHMTNGILPARFPNTIGHEPVGEIVELGRNVTSRRIGDRVGVPWTQHTCGRCEWCQRGKSLFCLEQIATGVNIAGGHAEFMAAYADATQLLPEGLEFEQAAPIFCAGYTVYSGLRIAEPKPHERIAIVGVGGLGHLAIQYAKVCGFETIAITHSKDKEELAYKLGADIVVSDGKGLKKTGGADVILATSNSYKATGDTLKGLRPDGRLVLMGLSDEPLTVTGHLLFGRGRIIGSLQNEREYLYEALDYVAKGKVRVMTESFPLDDMNIAYDKVVKGELRFRAVLKIP